MNASCLIAGTLKTTPTETIISMLGVREPRAELLLRSLKLPLAIQAPQLTLPARQLETYVTPLRETIASEYDKFGQIEQLPQRSLCHDEIIEKLNTLLCNKTTLKNKIRHFADDLESNTGHIHE